MNILGHKLNDDWYWQEKEKKGDKNSKKIKLMIFWLFVCKLTDNLLFYFIIYYKIRIELFIKIF